MSSRKGFAPPAWSANPAPLVDLRAVLVALVATPQFGAGHGAIDLDDWMLSRPSADLLQPKLARGLDHVDELHIVPNALYESLDQISGYVSLSPTGH